MSAHQARVAALYREHSKELVRFLAGRVQSRELAADLVQELFARLLAREGSVDDVCHDRGYLFASARHLASEAQRSPRWQESATAEDDEPPAELAPSPETLMADRQALEHLMSALERLPPRSREVFILLRLDGLSYRQAAERLGISVSAVEKHLMRALGTCRSCGIDRRAGAA